jgi:hypothetical protein
VTGTSLTVGVLREAFRSIEAFRATYETEGIDSVCSDGVEICLWDLEYLLTQLWRLPTRQRQAIDLCLVQNMKESDAALQMGVSITNPVAMYATSGLIKMVDWVNSGTLPRYSERASSSFPERETV